VEDLVVPTVIVLPMEEAIPMEPTVVHTVGEPAQAELVQATLTVEKEL
jgi:hypothetical protein